MSTKIFYGNLSKVSFDRNITKSTEKLPLKNTKRNVTKSVRKIPFSRYIFPFIGTTAMKFMSNPSLLVALRK